jgi:hypothetical protein
MNDELMLRIGWKIRVDRDTTLYQLHNGQLVDVQSLVDGKFQCFPYWRGKHDPDSFPNGAGGMNQLPEARMFEALEVLASMKLVGVGNFLKDREEKEPTNLPPPGYVDLYLA